MRWFENTGRGQTKRAVAITHDGVIFPKRTDPQDTADPVLEGLRTQWEDEGYAVQVEAGWQVPWDAVYAIRRSGYYDDALGAAGLGKAANLAPRLLSHGSLTDHDFSIGIAGWVDADGRPVDGVSLVGGMAQWSGAEGLLAETVWALVQRIVAFGQRGEAERQERAQRLAWGEIRHLALEANARLDDFLYRTVVLAPERLKIGLRRGDEAAGKLAEVVPDFEGSPKGWITAFDRAGSVRDRYDLPTPEGIVQVVISPPVRAVLEQVKRMPGRRVAGSRAEAFLANPFAALGASAAEVIDEEQFEQARAQAGLVFEHFTAWVESDTRGYPVSLGLFVGTATSEAGTVVRYAFANDAEAASFISKVRSHEARGLQLCAWDEFEFELLGDTPDQLRILEEALVQRQEAARSYFSPESVFDLTLYSPRIEGVGEEKPYASPYIARKDDGQGWFPENIVTLIGLPPEQPGGEPVYVPLSPEQIDALRVDVLQARKAGETSVRVPGVQKPVPIEELEHILDTFQQVEQEAAAGVLEPEPVAPRGRKALLLKPNIASVDYLEKRREILLDAPTEPDLPRALKADVRLKAHQLRGVAWLQHLFHQSPDHCRGAVLADDMGLGKTLQLLALIAWIREQDPKAHPALVVAPVALLENWANEVRQFFRDDALEVLEIYGERLAELRVPVAEIDRQLRADGLTRFLRPGWVGNADIVLTTYETLRDQEFSFAAEKWSVIVCDEAQKIKNPNALVTRAAKKQNARFRVACTGTPVENTLADLWCLFDFIQPGLLGALNEFGQKYRRPIEAETEQQRARVEELREQIKPQILRRMKADVARDLPAKNHDEDCKKLPLSTAQRSLYSQAVGQYGLRNDPAAATPFKNALGLLHYLRVVCTDPQPYGLTGFRAEPLAGYRQRAPKLDWLLHRLRQIRAQEEKALIFCEFRDMQRLLRHYIQEELGYTADIINGDTAASAKAQDSRQKRIQAFQARPGFGAIVLSPLAVGFGLNIQAANHVIHYTRVWNPAKEDQATDRAHRIGQTKTVHVYTPVVRADDFKTFDVKLDELLERKRALAQDMLNGSGDIGPGDFDVEGVAPPGVSIGPAKALTLEDVDRMTPRVFEALTAVLWGRRGFSRVDLTPASNDRGVDVVALDGGSGELVQCKHSGREGGQLGWEAIKDVVTGEAGYRTQYPGIQFTKVCVTNQGFNSTAREQAQHNAVMLVDRVQLAEMLRKPVTLDDVQRVLY